jgi:tripartite-type tricarboxylate transporter receptor subunit TctC
MKAWKWLINSCRMGVIALGLSGLSVAHAQDNWPERPVRVIVPFNAGGATDVITRIVAERVSKELGQSVIVENRGGAAGGIGVNHVIGAPADGTVFLMGTTGTNILSPFFMKSATYDTQRDLRGVGMIAGIPNLLVVNPKVPANDVAEFVSHARANPDEMTYAATGSGSRMAMELFMQQADIKLRMVPYKGSAPALIDLISGEVSSTMDLASSTLTAVEAGQLRALGISTKEPVSRAPNIPAIAQSGYPDFEFLSWQGVFAPKGTPDKIIDRMSQAITVALRDPDTAKKIQDIGAELMITTAKEMDDYIKSEVDRFTVVADKAGITPQ